MKLSRQKREELSSATITQTLALVLLCSGLFILTAYATDPSWWSSSGTGTEPAVFAPQVVTNDGVVTTNYVPNPYAAVTQGQLKQFTVRAVDELNGNLPGGAGTNLNSIVSNWASDYAAHGYNSNNIEPSDYTAMNVGQLKYIGNKVWVQLVAGGYTNALPAWLDTNSTDNQLANLGQLKQVFNFDLTPGLDPDGSGLPTAWEIEYFDETGLDPNSSPDGNGLTLLQDYQQGNDPTNYYSQGGLTITPVLTIVSGNSQTSASGVFETLPLIVKVADSTGAAMVNAPVTFTVTSGGGLLAATTIGSTASLLSATTDSNGKAQVYYQPTESGVTAQIAAVTSTQSVTFSEISTQAVAATPTLDVVAGTYDLQQTVSLSSTTPGATIYYTLDGTTPTTASLSVGSGGAVLISQSETLEAIAVASGYSNSATLTAAYTINDPEIPSSGMMLWLKADAGLVGGGGGSVALNGSVATWTDQSPAHNNATQTTGAAQPALASMTGGQKEISFNGSSQYLNLPSGFSDFSLGATVFTVFTPTTSNTGEQIVDLGNDSGDDDILMSHYDSATMAFETFVGGDEQLASSSGELVLNQAQEYTGEQDGSDSLQLFRNGILVGESDSVTAPNNILRTSSFVGNNNSGGPLFTGDIAEILVYNRPLSDTERQAVELYLAAKYQLAGTAAPPVISPNGAMFTSSQNVTISPEPYPAVVRYTLDGTAPTGTSPIYSGTINVTQDTLVTAAAFLNSVEISPSVSAQFYLDSDGDGLPDSWEMQYFGHLGVDPNADPDGDGLTNLQEFYAKTNPTVADTNSAITVSITTPPTATTFYAGGTIPVAAQASASGASISYVAFFAGSTYLGSSSTAPYACLFTNLPIGTTIVKAVAVASTGTGAVASVTISATAADSDGSGLPDDWQLQYFGHLGVDPNADPDGDGFTNLQEYQNGTDPTDYYNGQSVTLATVQGDGQTAYTGRYLDQSLEVKVTRSGTALVGAPVTFNVQSGSGILSIDLGQASSQNITAVTNASGIATVYYFQSSDLIGSTTVTATAGPVGSPASASFNLLAPAAGAAPPSGNGTPPTGTPPPMPTDPPPPTDGSVQLYEETVNKMHHKVGWPTFITTTPPQQWLTKDNFDNNSGTPLAPANDKATWDPQTETLKMSNSAVLPDMDVSDITSTIKQPTYFQEVGTYNGEYDECDSTLTWEYTTAGLITQTQADMPLFSTGTMTPANQFASYTLTPDELMFTLQPMQYRFVSTSSAVLTFNWLVVFQPTDPTQPILAKSMAITCVASSFPLTTIDPKAKGQTYDNGATPTNLNGTITVVPSELAVDANRDGTIFMANDANNPANAGLPVDTTSQTKPFRFWLNNDDDNGAPNSDTTPYASEVVPAMDGTPNEGPVPDVPSRDCDANYIVSMRDLEDWTRLWIYTKGLNQAIHDAHILVGLKWKQVTRGVPGIKIVQATDSDGGTEYLTDSSFAAASAQATTDGTSPRPLIQDEASSSYIISASASSDPSRPADFVFPSSTWTHLTDAAPKTFFLFEGASEGEGELEIVFLNADTGAQIGEGGCLWLDLRDIKEMYERETSQPVPAKPYNYALTPPTVSITPVPDTSNPNGNSGTFVPNPNEDTTNKTYIVFVHGFNMTIAGSTNYAETMFKRLWWRGYKGRFAAFRWNDYGNGTVWSFGGAIGTYNDSEFVAWHSGAALKNYVQSLPSGYTVDVVSHSLGSVVVGEAIEEGMSPAHYALLHAAASASCYSTPAQPYPTTNSSLSGSPDTSTDPATYALAYRYAFEDINSTHPVVNFYDTLDDVIGIDWEANNYTFKPQPIGGLTSDTYYYYHSYNPSGEELGFETDDLLFRGLTDFGEARAYADFSLTQTMGSYATTSAYGAISSGVDENQAGFGFGNHHSPEFNLSIQQLKPFYNALMGSFVLTPNP